MLCPDAGDGLMAGLDTGDLLVAGAAELETAEAGVPATGVALPVSLLGSADLAWGLAAVLPSAFVVAPTLVSPMERATGLSAAGLAAAFTGAVAAVLAVVAGDDVPVDFTTVFCTGWAAVGFTDAGNCTVIQGTAIRKYYQYWIYCQFKRICKRIGICGFKICGKRYDTILAS